jgi:zinc protease
MSDIQAYTREKLREHVNRFYTPDNAVIVLAGNIDPDQALPAIERYFGSIPRASEPKTEVVTREPPAIGETRFVVRDNAQPRIDMLFQTPGYPHDDLYRLDVVEGILSGRSGRLYQRLVIEEGLASNAGAGNAYRLHNGYFHVWAELRGNADPAEVESILVEEVRGLIENPPSPDEMARIQNSIRMSFVGRLKSLEGLSDQLAWFERMRSWKDMLSYPDKVAAVQAADIPEAITLYLRPELMTTGILAASDEASTDAAHTGSAPPTGPVH